MASYSTISRPLLVNYTGNGPTDWAAAIKSTSTYYATAITAFETSGAYVGAAYNGQRIVDMDTGRLYKMSGSGVTYTAAYDDNAKCWPVDGMPTGTGGQIGDTAFDYTNGQLWRKTGATTWTAMTNWRIPGTGGTAALNSGSAIFNLVNDTATTLNIGNAATTVSLGAATGTFTINNAQVTVTGDLDVRGGDLTTNQTTFNVFNTTATTVNAFGAATSLNIGASAGTATLNCATVRGAFTTQSLWNTVATTVNAFGAATSLNMGANSGTLTVGNPTVVGTQTTQALWNTTATTVNAFGAATTLNMAAASATTNLGGAIKIGAPSGSIDGNTSVLAAKNIVTEMGVTTTSGITCGGELSVAGFARSTQETASSADAGVNWNVDFSLGNVFFKRVTATTSGTAFDITIEQDGAELEDYKGGTFIISVYNAQANSITVTLKDSVMNTVNNEAITLTQNTGFSYTGVILSDGSTSAMYGVVAEISKCLL